MMYWCCSSLIRTPMAIPLIVSRTSSYYRIVSSPTLITFATISSSISTAADYDDGDAESRRRRSREGGHTKFPSAASKDRKKKDITTSPSWDDSANRFFSRNDNFTNDNGAEKEESKELYKRSTPPAYSRQGSMKREGWTSNRRNSYQAREELVVDPAEDSPRTRRNIYSRDRQNTWGRAPSVDSSVPKLVGQAIYGVGPVLAALTMARRELYSLYVQEGLDLSGNNKKKKDKKGFEKVIKSAEKIGLKVIEASKHDLNMVVDNRPHQGLVLDASPLEMLNIRELEAPVLMQDCKPPLWVALDEVMDPQNLGAIVRSAYFFGAQGVVLCAKNSAPLSGVVSKASAGSLELIELRSCKNMMQFLSSSIENGWRVLGGSVSPRSLPLGEVESGLPTILVLGSEGTGLRPLVERSCTHLVRIPGNMPVIETEQEPEEMDQSNFGRELKSFLAVESLNVSVAAGVLLYHLGGNNTPSAVTVTDTTSD